MTFFVHNFPTLTQKYQFDSLSTDFELVVTPLVDVH